MKRRKFCLLALSVFAVLTLAAKPLQSFDPPGGLGEQQAFVCVVYANTTHSCATDYPGWVPDFGCMALGAANCYFAVPDGKMHCLDTSNPIEKLNTTLAGWVAPVPDITDPPVGVNGFNVDVMWAPCFTNASCAELCAFSEVFQNMLCKPDLSTQSDWGTALYIPLENCVGIGG